MKRFAGVVLLKLWLRSSLLFLAIQVVAQDIPVGTWRTHFSYTNARLLERTQNKVFCAAESGLYSIDIGERSVRKLSKIDGLSDVAVSAMKYDQELNVLALGYTSGYVDLVFEDRIVSISEIANSDLDGDKRVNSIQFFGQQVYCATGLGIVVANASNGEIRENFIQIGVNGNEEEALQLEILEGSLFAVTQNGIQSGELNSNLLDFTNWTHFASTANFSNLAVVEDQIFALENQDLFRLENGIWSDTGVNLPTGASGLFVNEERIYTASSTTIYQLNEGQFEEAIAFPSTQINDLLIVDGEHWVADETLGLMDENRNILNPAGPFLNGFSKLKVINSRLYGFHAPAPEFYSGVEKVDEYSVFENGVWQTETIAGFQNISDVTDFQGQLFFSSIGDGLYNQTSNEFISNIPESNSVPDTVINELISGNQLWLSSFSNSNPIHSFDGSNWTSFQSTNLFGNEFHDLALSANEILWYRRSGSVFVFDNETQNAAGLAGLPGAVNDIEISLSDDPWLATEDGPVNFSDASFIFSSTEAILPSFDNRVLFEGERINAIETDGGNRVWFATDRGLWIFDRNISSQEELFNFNNSPIPSDRVLDLSYNTKNGEMFILTDKGLVSYRSASSNPIATHRNVRIFPNPVDPHYQGLVGLEGLARDVSVKITDINGHLVREIQVNGGSASWDLRSVSNAKVVTGIYLIFSSSSDGTETYVGKIAVIK